MDMDRTDGGVLFTGWRRHRPNHAMRRDRVPGDNVAGGNGVQAAPRQTPSAGARGSFRSFHLFELRELGINCFLFDIPLIRGRTFRTRDNSHS